jgi:hypothetical protein
VALASQKVSKNSQMRKLIKNSPPYLAVLPFCLDSAVKEQKKEKNSGLLITQFISFN